MEARLAELQQAQVRGVLEAEALRVSMRRTNAAALLHPSRRRAEGAAPAAEAGASGASAAATTTMPPPLSTRREEDAATALQEQKLGVLLDEWRATRRGTQQPLDSPHPATAPQCHAATATATATSHAPRGDGGGGGGGGALVDGAAAARRKHSAAGSSEAAGALGQALAHVQRRLAASTYGTSGDQLQRTRGLFAQGLPVRHPSVRPCVRACVRAYIGCHAVTKAPSPHAATLPRAFACDLRRAICRSRLGCLTHDSQPFSVSCVRRAASARQQRRQGAVASPRGSIAATSCGWFGGHASPRRWWCAAAGAAAAATTFPPPYRIPACSRVLPAPSL
jgi:hypothetical protein